MCEHMDVVVLGLSITSSWGNGHATTYRSLLKGLADRGHRITFLERDVPWYAAQRDMPQPPFCDLHLYDSFEDLRGRFGSLVREADAVIVGSYVPEGVEIGEWCCSQPNGLVAFYDIDTPVTLGKLSRGDDEYLSRELIPLYDLYLSFSGGPTLDLLERRYGARRARPLYCCVDEQLYFPEERPSQWDLGYMGTYSPDRQLTLQTLLMDPASLRHEGRFIVAGPQFPDDVVWPRNVDRIEHLPPDRHRAFYAEQRFALNVTRAEMIAAGHSPSVRLFEAAACGTPIISDFWQGLDSFFTVGEEILVCRSAEESLRCLRGIEEDERLRIGRLARRRVLAEHTAARRAEELETYLFAALGEFRGRVAVSGLIGGSES